MKEFICNKWYYFYFSIAFVVTIIVETVILFIFRNYSFFRLNEIDVQRIIFAWFFTSFSTLPYLWFVFPSIFWYGYLLHIFWELIVIFIESIILKFVFDLSFSKSFIISLIVNLASYFVWILIYSF